MKYVLVAVLGVPLLAQTKTPTYAHDIAPILYKSCAPCHRPGESGPFSLLTYGDAKRHASEIAAVTRSRYMPPWLPEPGYGDFADDRRLTDEQIELISEWVSAKAPGGPASESPAPPHFTEGWQLGPPDLILEAPHPLTLSASGPDVFWNFIYHPQLSSTRYVRAIEIRPGDKRVVHHANLIIDRMHSSEKRETTAGAGFPGMDLDIESTVFDPAGHFLFWKPGSTPRIEPDGFAWRLDPGNDLVLNTHLKLTGKPEKVQPSVGLYFTDKPQTQFPVLIQLEHDGNLRIPAGNRDFLVTDDFRLPMDVEVLAVYPHAHYLGKVLEGYATLPDGKRLWLIRINDWDLNWQAVYDYRTPVFLPKGTVISMRYQYDNSAANPRNPNRPPRMVEAGNQATDEMGHLWLQVLIKGPGDRRRELEEALMRHHIAKYPGDGTAYLNLGALMLSRLETQGAVTVLENAVTLQPEDSQAHNLLGAAFSRVGRLQEAIANFQTALKLDSDNANARYNLVYALVKAGKLDEAADNLRAVVAAYPDDASLYNLWGELLVQQGKLPDAIAEFDKAITLKPDFEDARKNREITQARIGK
ncbi:MAG: tetratricopeptide repeat protein [Bryobacteraceae bacterium]